MQNNVQHCVQIALLGEVGERWGRRRTNEGEANSPFQRRLKCKSPLWMCISTIYEYLLIFFLFALSFSLPLPFCLSSSLRNGKTFASSAHFIPQNVSLTFFYMLNASLLYNFLMTVLLAIFCWRRRKNTFLCMQPAKKPERERERVRPKTTRKLQNYGQFFIEFKWVD